MSACVCTCVRECECKCRCVGGKQTAAVAVEVEDGGGAERGGGVLGVAGGVHADEEALEGGAVEPAAERAAVVGGHGDVLEVVRGRAEGRGVEPRGLEVGAEERPALAARDKDVQQQHGTHADRQQHANCHHQYVQHRGDGGDHALHTLSQSQRWEFEGFGRCGGSCERTRSVTHAQTRRERGEGEGYKTVRGATRAGTSRGQWC